MKKIFSIVAVLSVAACSQQQDSVRVTSEKPVAPQPASSARVEPVFYNGKTYQFRLTPLQAGSYQLSVRGMSSAQQKDAVAVATSSLRYFACREGQTGKLATQPRYANGIWSMTAGCA